MRKLVMAMAVLLVLFSFNVAIYAIEGEKVDEIEGNVSYTESEEGNIPQGNVAHKNKYTDTVNAVFDVLNGKIFENPLEPGPGGYEGTVGNVHENPQYQEDPQGTPNTPSENTSQGGNYNNHPPQREHLIPGVKYDFNSTILERLQKDHKVTTGGPANTINTIGTTIHQTLSQWVISLAPIFLIIAVGMMMFSSSRAAGFLVMCGVAIFVILFAPELVKIFINAITGIFY